MAISVGDADTRASEWPREDKGGMITFIGSSVFMLESTTSISTSVSMTEARGFLHGHLRPSWANMEDLFRSNGTVIATAGGKSPYPLGLVGRRFPPGR